MFVKCLDPESEYEYDYDYGDGDPKDYADGAEGDGEYEYVGYNGDDADVVGGGGCDDNDGVQLVACRLIFSCVASWRKHRTTGVVHSTR